MKVDIRTFAAKIKEQEDQLFGIKLFMLGIRKMWGFNENIIGTNEIALQNILERNEPIIAEAKKLLREVKSNKKDAKVLDECLFLPIGGSGLDDLTNRANLLVKTYEKLFPGRSREMPLNDEENNILMQEVIRCI